MFNISLTIHIVLGCLAVSICWVPLISKKGNAVHVNWGKFYIIVMSFTVITALILMLFAFE